ncbi:MAG: hypothetical protein ABIO40_05645 [Devosia sp.]
MKKPVKPPPKKPNLAARALRDPLFRPKIVANPKAYKRRKQVEIPLNDDDQVN